MIYPDVGTDIFKNKRSCYAEDGDQLSLFPVMLEQKEVNSQISRRHGVWIEREEEDEDIPVI
jgi:hypothetical protein